MYMSYMLHRVYMALSDPRHPLPPGLAQETLHDLLVLPGAGAKRSAFPGPCSALLGKEDRVI